MKSSTLADKGLRTLQEAVLAALKEAPTDGMSTNDIAEALGIPHSADWHHHLAKQLLFHMERRRLVEDVRESVSHPHWWVAAPPRQGGTDLQA
ncbi:MAG: hypothetical protein OXF61_02560 [Acidimicrobiaceae bacterium]|nr:hypothetical protein [Acidimicrobiaceae bacterium]MCY3948066.1 hypothetical protein [Acidimicrobiaceae bacterium]